MGTGGLGAGDVALGLPAPVGEPNTDWGGGSYEGPEPLLCAQPHVGHGQDEMSSYTVGI